MVNSRFVLGLAVICVLEVAVPSTAHADGEENPFGFVADGLTAFMNHSARALQESWNDAYWTPQDYEDHYKRARFRAENWEYWQDPYGAWSPCTASLLNRSLECDPPEPGGLKDQFPIWDTGWEVGYAVNLRGKALPFDSDNLNYWFTIRGEF